MIMDVSKREQYRQAITQVDRYREATRLLIGPYLGEYKGVPLSKADLGMVADLANSALAILKDHG